jgi:ribosomal-protein-alanine N-acetyltransferase
VLETAHLTLVPSDPRALLALIEAPERFPDLTGLALAEELRAFYVSGDVSPRWIAALRDAAERGPDPWRHGFFVVERGASRAIGSAGFKGPPDAGGMVEIAYGIVPSRQGRGFATEAAEALLRFAEADARVRLLRAHTLPEANASTRVLTKCGFLHVADVVDPEDGPVWRWERSAQHIGPR